MRYNGLVNSSLFCAVGGARFEMHYADYRASKKMLGVLWRPIERQAKPRKASVGAPEPGDLASAICLNMMPLTPAGGLVLRSLQA